MALTESTLNNVIDYIKTQQIDTSERLFVVHDGISTALNDIIKKIQLQNPNLSLKVVSHGSFATQTHYANYEPLEFFVIMKSDRQTVNHDFVTIQKSAERTHKKVKQSFWERLLGIKNDVLALPPSSVTASELAKMIMQELTAYLGTQDRLAAINGTIKLKLTEQKLMANITVAYELEDSNLLYYIKYPFIHSLQYAAGIQNLLDKENQTKGEFSFICQFAKFLEVELVLMEKSSTLYCLKNGFSEQIFYNIPDHLFTDDKLATVSNVFNYLNNADLKAFILADGTKRNLFDNTEYSLKDAKNFVKKLIYAYKNFDELFNNGTGDKE